MVNLKNKRLAVFVDTGSSLEIWDKMGFLNRELNLYNYLAKKFNKVYIFTYGNKRELNFKKNVSKNIEIIPKVGNLHDYIYELTIPFGHRKILSECDVYKTMQNTGALAPTIAKWMYKKKLIVRSGYIRSLHYAKFLSSPWYMKIYVNVVEFLSYLTCDKAFIPMKNNYEILLKKYPFLKNKLIIMNNFIDTKIFKPFKMKKKWDIVYVANLQPNKNHMQLLQAVKNLNLSLCFIGQGAQEEKLIKYARLNKIKLDLIKRVPNEELPEYYNSAEICVFPSLHEGNPKALLEPMSCEIPVVGFDVIGVRDIIKNGENGIISKLNTNELRKKILYLLSDKKLQKRLGKNARKYILENFSLDKLAKKEINIYEELLK